MTTLALALRASIAGTLTVTRDAGDATIAINEAIAATIEAGGGAGQANLCYVDDFSIALSSSMTIDLAGALVDPLKEACVFAAVKAIFIKADSTNVNDIIVGNATNAWVGPFGAAAHTITIKPGGFALLSDGISAAGWAVGAGATDELKLANSGAGTAVTGTIVIIGE